MTWPTIGSLFTGYGGLDLAAETVFNGETVWTCDVDPAASRILTARFPDAPNLGDITPVDWTTVLPVDIVTGGFPCTDISHAGLGLGLMPGTRSGLWARMADAINHLRPALVIIENVRGILSAPADSDVEPCPWCMGGAGDGEPPLRALGSVLADLADLGYDTAWHGLRAADVGAPHARFRVFILAWPADADCSAGGRTVPWVALGRDGETADARRGPAESRGRAGLVTDADGGQPERRRGPSLMGSAPATEPHEGLQRERAGHTPRHGGAAIADTDGDGLEGVGWVDPSVRDAHGRCGPDVAWGDYGPAVRRWESVLGRPAPAPTELSPAYVAMVARRRARLDPRPVGRRGSLRPVRRLSPRFVEWMMGLPAGWVTDVPGLSRNDQLKALGNGVVPQQAATALRTLLAWRAAAVGEGFRSA